MVAENTSGFFWVGTKVPKNSKCWRLYVGGDKSLSRKKSKYWLVWRGSTKVPNFISIGGVCGLGWIQKY